VTGVRPTPFGDRALLVELGAAADVHRLRTAIAGADLPGVEDVVAGATSVVVITTPGAVDLEALAARVSALPISEADGGAGRLVTIPVSYDGPDLDDVACHCRISSGEAARRHRAPTYTVAFMGFSPGFAYLTGGDPALRVPRLHTPRPRVPAGALAIADDLTAVYPQSTPGGWRIIGTAHRAMFDAGRRPPSLLEPGDRVRFVDGDRPSDGQIQAIEGSATTGGAGPAPAPGRWVEVVKAGPLTTVQDGGRPGFAHLGVPRAGAADPASLASANRAVGNPPATAGLEATVSGPRLVFGRPGRVAVVGAAASVDGEEVTEAEAHPVPEGGVLTVGAARPGLRAYVAVDGGFACAAVLGSRSADTLSGLGPPPLSTGQRLPLGEASPEPPRVPPDRAHRPPGGEVAVRVVDGPHADRFPGGARSLCDSLFTVTTMTDRTGVRLTGAALASRGAAEVEPLGMVPGAVQVPGGGEPIVLLANHATTGGYPVVGVVCTADLPLLAQARPGARVRFVAVTPAEAAAALASIRYR